MRGKPKGFILDHWFGKCGTRKMFHVKHFGGGKKYAHGNGAYVSLGYVKGNQGYRMAGLTVLGVDRKFSKFNNTIYARVN